MIILSVESPSCCLTILLEKTEADRFQIIYTMTKGTKYLRLIDLVKHSPLNLLFDLVARFRQPPKSGKQVA
jgi:hypothetical protein